MRLFAISIMAAAVVVGMMSAAEPVRAQPAGSYLETCRDVEVRGKKRPNALLIAECQTRRGHWIESSLYYKQCRGDIYNDNGRLMCQGGQSGNAGGLPPGTWRQTCRDAYLDGRYLNAECRTTSGRWQDATLNLNACPNAPLSNQNGRLVCGGGGFARSRLTLYPDTNFRGRALQLTGPAPDLRTYNFNDRASSLRVEGNWYVCSDIYYAGECSKVAGEFNLNSKWNKRISSARPAQ
jgi:hypothetical protein